MADDQRKRGLPPRDVPEESQYPPPPGEEEEDERARAYHHLPPPMTTGMTLPSIHDPHAPSHYQGVPSQSRYPPPPDPRDPQRSRGDYSASPSGSNGYPPPPPGFLPPVQPHPDNRLYGVDARDYHYGRGAVYPPPPPDPYTYPPYRPSPGSPYGGGYGPGEYGRGGASQQAAPRQRTSIACRYCRKRKIRCSGYQQTPDGKCVNCKKTGNECVFQPVSSGSTTAFVPVSALPGGVPPGTPLYGAFGQPLAPSGPGGQGQGQGQGHYPPGSGDYNHPLPSPTGSGYYGQQEDRAENARRRPYEDEHGPRLPPPNTYGDGSRRSPASAHDGTPPTAYEYAPPRTSDYEPTNRTPTPQRHSPRGPPSAPAQGAPGPSVMSLNNLVDHPAPRPPPSADSTGRDIDQSMLGRLNKRT